MGAVTGVNSFRFCMSCMTHPARCEQKMSDINRSDESSGAPGPGRCTSAAKEGEGKETICADSLYKLPACRVRIVFEHSFSPPPPQLLYPRREHFIDLQRSRAPLSLSSSNPPPLTIKQRPHSIWLFECIAQHGELDVPRGDRQGWPYVLIYSSLHHPDC